MNICSVFYFCRQFTLPFSISIQAAAESVIILFTLSDRICESLSRHLIALKVLVVGRDLIDQLAVDDLHDTVCGRLYDLMVTGGENDHARELLHSVIQGCDGLHVQMVSRLIEHQHVRAGDHHLGEHAAEPQADVIREAAEAYEEATGISVEIQWKGRGIRSLIEPALDAGEQIDLFDDDYQRMAQEHRDYLAELKGMADTVDYEKHIMPVLLEQVKNWGNGELLAMPYQPYITGVWYNKDLWEEAGLTEQDIPDTWEKLIRVCRKIKNSDSGLSAMTCDEEYVNLLYGYQLARYLGQEKVQQLIRNCIWSQIPQAKEAADDIRILFFAGYMSQSAPAQHPEGQDEVGDGEAVMVLQGSWVPNEVTEATESDDSWGFFPWPAVKAGTDGTEGVMVGAQGFGVTKDSQMKQEAFDFAYSICTGETDMKMTDAVNSIPADTDNTQWPEVLADAVPYMKEMSKPYMWAAGLEADPDYKEQIQSELLKLTRLEETSDEFIENLSNMK